MIKRNYRSTFAKKVIAFILLIICGLLLIFILTNSPHDQNLKTQKQQLESVPTDQNTVPQAIFSLKRSTETVIRGQILTVNVVLDSPGQILATDLFITYDPKVLKFVKITPLDFFSSPMEFSKKVNKEEGKIFYALGSLSPASGKKDLISLTFSSQTNVNHPQIILEEKTLVAVKGGKEARVILPTP